MRTRRKPSSYLSRQVESSRLFFLEEEPREEFGVVFGGFERCRRDYRIDRRSFPWHCLEFVHRGQGTLHLDGGDYELSPGSFYFYGPGIAQRIESSATSPLRKYFVGFTGRGVGDFLDACGIEPGMVVRCLKSEPIRRSFDQLIDRGVRKSEMASPLCSLITRQLLLMFRDDAADPVNTASPAFTKFVRAREFIEANFLELDSLEATASKCGIDAPYLCRLFSRYHDESPYQFLTRLRMDHASRLLLDGNVKVKTVAAMMGFRDAFHFSRVFKSVHQVPPSRFRQSTHPQWPGM
jgi:AraC-like DNA-binding protein